MTKPLRPWLPLLCVVLATAACGDDDDDAPRPPDGSADAPLDPSQDGGSPETLPDASGDGLVSETGTVEAASDVSAPPPIIGPRWVRLYTPASARVDLLTVDAQGNLFLAHRSAGGFPSLDERDRVSPGVYRSRDLGVSWEPASRGMSSYGFSDLEVVGDLLLAGADTLIGSRDGGQSWLRLSSAFYRVPSVIGGSGSLIFAASSDFGTPVALRSTDAGMTFQAVTFRQEAREISAVAVRGSLVLVGHREGLQRSTDGGLNFEPVVLRPAIPEPYVPQVRQIAIQDDRVVFALGGGRTLRSEDGGITWQAASVDGDPAAFFNSIASDGQGQVLIGGARGTSAPVATAWRSSDAGKTWQALSLLPATATPTVAFARGSLLAGTNRGLQFSSDAGKTWSWRNGPQGGLPARSLTRLTTALAIDRLPTALGADGDLFIHDGEALWRSSDAAETWTKLPFPGTGGPCFVSDSAALLCGGHRSVDHGATWVEMQFIGRASISSFAGFGTTLYAVANGQPWRSDDDGVTWIEAGSTGSSYGSGGTIAVNRAGVVFHQSKRSFDKGMNWQEIGHHISFVDDKDRLYEVGREWLSVSTDGGTTFRGITAGSPAFYPSTLGKIYVLPDDRLWAHVDTAASGSDGKKLLGDRVFHATVNVAPPTPVLPPAPGDQPSPWTEADEGLEQGAITAFARDRSGHLYAATNGGLYRFIP
jgi:photosystem II stability/assembly factor-like uncharacterized protein